ncbi:hypothetical protein EBU71_07785 [bacterium]|jgi:hypothetical protein|nr:hypothetical protein [Candidatus Elulimicrobium humile]
MTTEQNVGEWDSLLTEEAQEGEEYIQPNIELELPVNKRKDCRDIVMEIRKFGVSQRQMLYIIYLLSLELEDNKTMKAIAKAIGENRKNVPVTHTLERSTTSSIIIPGKD